MKKGSWSGTPEGPDPDAFTGVVASSHRKKFVNGSFNIPTITGPLGPTFTDPPKPYWWFTYAPLYSGWTFVQNAGIALAGSAFSTDPLPEGATGQNAFLHDVIGSTIPNFHQKFRIGIGEYKLSFDVLGWNVRGGPTNLEVLLDDSQILLIPAASVPLTWTLQEVTITIPQTGLHKLEFRGVRDPGEPDDRCTMINDVQIIRTD